jgi:membrane-associated phospholipid phosphatase
MPKRFQKMESAPPRRSAFSLLLWPVVLTILGFAALPLDLPLARWYHAGNNPEVLRKGVDLIEVFGHGVGIAVILFSVWVLAPQWRSKMPRTITSVYLAGLTALSLKLVLARNRPYRTPLDTIGGVAGTFGHKFPGFSVGAAWQSFPSGHTAAAVGLAMALTWLMPRGKWLFAGLVALVALQRISGGYHYLSDTLWGAAIGCWVASAFLPGGWISKPFDRLEERAMERNS